VPNTTEELEEKEEKLDEFGEPLVESTR